MILGCPQFGDPDSDIALGTPFEDLPADWLCPDCSAEKEFREGGPLD